MQWKLLREQSKSVRLSTACAAFPEFAEFFKTAESIKIWLSNVESMLVEAGSDDQKMTVSFMTSSAFCTL
jgi:hypothetical protein